MKSPRDKRAETRAAAKAAAAVVGEGEGEGAGAGASVRKKPGGWSSRKVMGLGTLLAVAAAGAVASSLREKKSDLAVPTTRALTYDEETVRIHGAAMKANQTGNKEEYKKLATEYGKRIMGAGGRRSEAKTAIMPKHTKPHYGR